MGFFQFIIANIRWLAAGFLLTLMSSFGQTYFISIFAGEIRAEFGLSHSAWGGIYTLGTSAAAVAMIWGGALADRFRARSLGTVFLALLAAACVSMALNPAAATLVLVIFALRFTGQSMMGHIAIVTAARWFVASRGRAISIVSMGFAAGQAVLPVIFVALLVYIDWRMLWVIAAVLTLGMVPILRTLLQNERTPQSVATENQSLGMDARHWPRKEVLRHWLFWLMVPMTLGPAAWCTALFFQQVELARTKGWDHADFVAMFPIYTAAAVFGTILTGWLIDRFGTNRLVPFVGLPFVIGFWLMGTSVSLVSGSVAMIVIGAATGASSTLPGAFWAEHFGTRHLGSVKAIATSIMVFGSAIGPGITGFLIDFGMPFDAQLFWFSGYFVASTALATIGVRTYRARLAFAS